MERKTNKDNSDLIGLILGIISLAILLCDFFSNLFCVIIVICLLTSGFILSMFSQNKRPLKVFGIMVNGLGIVVSLILLVVFAIAYVLFG